VSEGHHIISVKVYARTLAALLVLTVITVAASRIDLGANLNIVLAMVIATVKGTLVCCFFMGLWFDRPLNSLIFASGLIFLFCFFLLVFADIGVRGTLYEDRAEIAMEE